MQFNDSRRALTLGHYGISLVQRAAFRIEDAVNHHLGSGESKRRDDPSARRAGFTRRSTMSVPLRRKCSSMRRSVQVKRGFLWQTELL